MSHSVKPFPKQATSRVAEIFRVFFFAEYFHIMVKLQIPYLDSRVHVIVDIIVFQHSMAIVIEVDPNLLK